MFKINFLVFFSFLIVSACNSDKNVPDVSAIKVVLPIERFENNFFKIDTNNIEDSLDSLQKKYGTFTQDFIYNIIGADANKDSAIKFTKYFLNDSIYKSIHNYSIQNFNNLSELQKEIILALKLTKHYFPSYNLPQKLITFIGPIDGVGSALTSNHDIAIGLQGFLGNDYPAYQSAYITQIYPSYKTRRFKQEYISTNIMKNIIEEIYPNQSTGRPLIEQMVELGKRMYVLDALLPYVSDTVKTGYTANQLSECNKNEAFIFSFFVQNNLLFEREISIIMPFVNDGPKTPELSETAPGNIGQFIGWQIVKQWMKENNKLTLVQLLNTPAQKIFNAVKYKP